MADDLRDCANALYESITNPPEEPEAPALIHDEQGFAYHPLTGEITLQEEPDPDVAAVIDWLGPKRAHATARLAGLEAEKAAWLAKVAAQYDARIQRQRHFIDYLDWRFGALLRAHAARLLEGRKERTVRAGLLTLAFRRTQPRVIVEDEARAVEWLTAAGLTEAVKTTRTVLKSAIPPGVRATVTLESAGMIYVPAEDEFEIK